MKKTIFLLFLIYLLFVSRGFCLQKKNVLIINSYDPTYIWARNVVNSLTKMLSGYTLYIEFMDTKRFSPNKMSDIFLSYLNEKYKHIKMDLIIVSDNNALNFVVNYRKRLVFKNTPIVFCGINGFKESMLGGYKDITGVVEEIYYNQVVDLILKLQPEIKKIFIIVDATLSNQVYLNDIENIKKEYKNKIDIEIINGKFLGIEKFTEKLQNIPKNSAIIFLTLLRLGDGTLFDFKSGVNYIYTHTNVPMYGLVDISLNMPGVVGGVVTSSVLQGEYAGHFARQILDIGIPAQVMPILRRSPNKVILDYRELLRFHIDQRNIPLDAEIINRPPSLVRLVKQQEKRIVFLEILTFSLVIFFLLFVLNYLAKRRLQKELLEKNLQFNTLINGSDDIICLKDGNSRIILANNAFVDLFDLHDYDYIGHPCSDISKQRPLCKDVFFRDIEFDKKAWEEKRSLRYFATLDSPGAENKVLDIIKTPIFDSRGKKKYLIVIARDVTEYKELENQLIHSQKMELLGLIAGGIAHDFNNIISALMMNAELLSLKIGDNKLKKYLDNIIKGLNAASDLVKKIKLMSIKEEVKFEPISFKEVLERTLTLTQPVMPSNISLNIDFDSEKQYIILGHIGQLSQVMMNLILNARDAIVESNKEKGEILVVVKERENNLFIYVKDNGCGIKKEDRHRIFDPFYTTKKDLSQKGTGLGLSITKNIIKEHKGEIRFETEVGQGTTFIITLPLFKGDIEINNKDKIIKLSDDLMGKTILVIDDEEEILAALEEMLKVTGMNVIRAKNGYEGIKILDKNKDNIHIIFVDWKMPVLGGKDTIEKIRDIGIRVPIFIVSGYIDQDIKEFKEQGLVTDIISKPFTWDRLVCKLNSICKTH